MAQGLAEWIGLSLERWTSGSDESLLDLFVFSECNLIRSHQRKSDPFNRSSAAAKLFSQPIK